MASRSNLSSLVHELGERIAASSSTPPNNGRGGDDALETRFRAVLPNLLNAYVVPSPSANEREVVAVLKLISHVARNFPGVFFHGKATVVLPVIGRILPFFADPSFSERDAYCQFVVDAMVMIEDLLYTVSINGDESCVSESIRLTLKCFSGSFAGIAGDSACLCDLPASNKPPDGFGILMNLNGNRRWQTFTTWMIKLLSKCMSDGMIFVEGLLSLSFVSSACSLLSYGDADLQMACLDFARITGFSVSYDIIPQENIILSIATILKEDNDGLSVYRHTAPHIISVFPLSIGKSRSEELKVALCNAYVRIAKTCPPYIWRPELLIQIMCNPEPCFLVTRCLQIAASILGLDRFGDSEADKSSLELSTSRGQSKFSKVGEKRFLEDGHGSNMKRQKISTQGEALTADVQLEHRAPVISGKKENYADNLHKSVVSLIDILKSPTLRCGHLTPDVALTALSMLCIAFSKHPYTTLSVSIFQQAFSWLPCIIDQAKKGCAVTLDISLYLEAIHSILLLQSPLIVKLKLFCDVADANLLVVLLKLPWTHPIMVSEQCSTLWKAKVKSLQVFSKIGAGLNGAINLEILDLCLHDEAEDVIVEAVISMPVIVLWSGLGSLTHLFRTLRLLENFGHEKVKRTIPFSIGFLSCLYGSCNNGQHGNNSCKLFPSVEVEQNYWTTDFLMRGFWCSKCDRRNIRSHDIPNVMIPSPERQRSEFHLEDPFMNLQSLFFKLIYDASD